MYCFVTTLLEIVVRFCTIMMGLNILNTCRFLFCFNNLSISYHCIITSCVYLLFPQILALLYFFVVVLTVLLHVMLPRCYLLLLRLLPRWLSYLTVTVDVVLIVVVVVIVVIFICVIYNVSRHICCHHTRWKRVLLYRILTKYFLVYFEVICTYLLSKSIVCMVNIWYWKLKKSISPCTVT